MSYAVVVRRIAEAELELAKAWYNLNAPGLGEEFVTAFEDAAHAIAEGPLRWRRYHNCESRRFASFAWSTPVAIRFRSVNFCHNFFHNPSEPFSFCDVPTSCVLY